MTLSRRPFLAFTGLAPLFQATAARAAETLEGSGVAVSQRRDVGAFGSVALGGPFEVVLRPGAREGIEVRGDDNIVAAVETTVESTAGKRSLRIELKRGVTIRPRTPVVVHVDFVRLDAVAVGGSGRLTGSGIQSASLAASVGGSGSIALAQVDAGDLHVSIGGAGTVEVEGRANALGASIAGSGGLNAARLKSASVSINIAGSGNARVHADGALAVSIAGSGSVVHSGSAVPSSSIVGSGGVKRAA